MRTKITCCDCRCTITIDVSPYPHGPVKITMCPVCGNQDLTIVPDEVMPPTMVRHGAICPQPPLHSNR